MPLINSPGPCPQCGGALLIDVVGEGALVTLTTGAALIVPLRVTCYACPYGVPGFNIESTPSALEAP